LPEPDTPTKRGYKEAAGELFDRLVKAGISRATAARSIAKFDQDYVENFLSDTAEFETLFNNLKEEK
jgi:hypothetical protein